MAYIPGPSLLTTRIIGKVYARSFFSFIND